MFWVFFSPKKNPNGEAQGVRQVKGVESESLGASRPVAEYTPALGDDPELKKVRGWWFAAFGFEMFCWGLVGLF